MDYRGTSTQEAYINALINKRIYRINANSPAIITAVDYKKQLINCKLGYRLRVQESGALSSIDVPELTNIPFLSLGGGDFVVTAPPAVGDFCVVHFANRDCTSFNELGQAVDVETVSAKVLTLDCAYATTGYTLSKNVINDYDTTGLTIRNRKNDKTIKLDNGKIEVKAKESTATVNDAVVSLKQGDTATVEVSAGVVTIKVDTTTVSINGTTITMQSGDVTAKLSGETLEVSGNLKVSGTVTVADNMTITGDSATANGAVLTWSGSDLRSSVDIKAPDVYVRS